MLAGKVDDLFEKMDRLHPTSAPSGSSSGEHAQMNFCDIYGIQGHTMSERHLGQLPQDLTVKQANAFHTTMQDHLMTLTPLRTIRGGGIILMFPTKPQILHLTILPNVIQTLRASNILVPHNINLRHPLHKNPNWKA